MFPISFDNSGTRGTVEAPHNFDTGQILVPLKRVLHGLSCGKKGPVTGKPGISSSAASTPLGFQASPNPQVALLRMGIARME